jgi:TonB family protein
VLAAWMLYTVIVSALIGLAAVALERARSVIGRPARWIWAAAVVLALGLTLAPWVLPGGEWGLPARGSSGSVDGEELLAGSALSRIPGAIEVPSSGFLSRLDRPLAWAWAGGVLALLGWLGAATVVLRRRLRGWERVRMGGREVLVSSDTGPALLGVLRTRVVLPRWCLDLPEEATELVLAHEDEHRRAGDTGLVFGATTAALLLPWNLPLWWMLRRLRTAVEVDCDARVLDRFPGRRKLYGELLLLVCSRRVSPSGALATFAEHRSTLGRRIRMLSRVPEERPVRRAIILSVAGGLLIVVACLVPGPDRDVPGLTGPDGTEAARDSAEPMFTPYEVAPEVLNPGEVQQALREEYPSLLRDAGIGGVVLLHLHITEEGRVRHTALAESSGHEALDRAAERAAQAFRFSPAVNRDQEVPVWVQVPIRFEPGERQAAAAGRDVPVRGARDTPAPATDQRDPVEGPSFTPFDVAPEVLNASAVQEALQREYPSLLRDAGIGGVVMAHVFIREDGGVAEARVAEGSGHAALDQAALRVAREFRFSPAQHRGEEVSVWVQIPIRFQDG